MKVSFSYHNQLPENGALPRLAWLHYGNKTSDGLRCIGGLRRTSWGEWAARVDHPSYSRGDRFFPSYRDACAWVRGIYTGA